MNTNSLNLVIDGYGFAILVTGGSATLFDTLEDLKFHASLADIDLSEFECMWAYKLSPALLAKYGLECGSPTPEQPEGQPDLSTETVYNSCSICGKTNFDTSTVCKKACVFSPAVGDWVCFSPLRNGGSYVSI
ncbi:hypothetical protein ABC502_14580 [Alkalimonas sp. NCh-2]|uniref:hypothetical protein n=1 Tax=Alkalimonas sp. NCh-2 TaxID=3144846 RepID=UPI0031F63861